MAHGIARTLGVTLLSLGLLSFNGCRDKTDAPSVQDAPKPTVANPKVATANKGQVEVPLDDAEAVAALQRVAELKRDQAGHVTEARLQGPDVTDVVVARLRGTPRIKVLRCEACGITDAGTRVLAGLDSLEFLSLTQLDVGDKALDNVSRLKNLKRLKLARCPNVTAEGLAELAECHGLVQLDLRDCTQVDDNWLRQISKLTTLRDLKLNSPKITDAGLAGLEPLTHVAVLGLDDCTGISNAGFAIVQSMPEMTFFSACRTPIGDAGLAHFSGAVNMRRLRLANTQISNAGLAVLESMPKLESLDVSGCAKIGDDGMQHLKLLGTLRDLNLYLTHVGDAGVAQLSGLVNLEQLNLDKTQVTDAGLVHLRPLVRLKFIHLGHAKITDAGLENLTGMANLEKLVATYTDVTQGGVAKLRAALPKLEVVEIGTGPAPE